MYLNDEHFSTLLQREGINPEEMDNRERLSSKACLFSTGSRLYIFYVNTLVFKKEGATITLNSGGWETNTTKKWINRGFSIVGMPSIGIIQKNRVWHLVNDNKKIDVDGNLDLKRELIADFSDGMRLEISPNGESVKILK